MSSGHIRRAAALAATCALLDGAAAPAAEHRRRAAATLAQETLDGLATRVPPLADVAEVVLAGDTADEFAVLVARCRHREQLGEAVGASLGAQLGCGVRALFRGPSGCGKTLAARRLAASLEREIYRVDLAAVVDKYIGESEKRLARVLDRAEEVDAVLLFDEGDSLLGKRTAVQSSTDRYANLETNFLLQRLDEGFGGILVVTTNSAEQIDSAFKRRMDAVIDFRLPDALERQALWRLHLPPQHAVDEDFIDEASFRCQLAGGQIRNAVLHAALTAIQRGSRLRTEHLEAAIRREYRKNGGTCPLRGTPAKA
jgi:SpoVK/Ycf46/Vps4 family AAA+-type ATPase